MNRFWLLIKGIILLVLSYISFAVQADESRPLYLELTELNTNSYKLQWKVPASVPAANAPVISMPAMCDPIQLQRQGLPARLHGQTLYRCAEPIYGQVITIEYPAFNPSLSSLVKFKTLRGEQHTLILSPQELRWTVPRVETPSQVAWDYTLLGVHHIWIGIDHLLFLVCLLWIAGSLRRILVTVTGFTIAHSMTLVLSALEIVRLPVAPVEAVIALSIVFLATEIVKGYKGSTNLLHSRQTLTWRYPITVSSSFGLLHGFGFSAALEEVGLPQTELLTGLLFFNVGVEIGQVLFVTVVALLLNLIKRCVSDGAGGGLTMGQLSSGILSRVMSYAVGALASFWVIERSVAFLLVT